MCGGGGGLWGVKVSAGQKSEKGEGESQGNEDGGTRMLGGERLRKDS